MASNRVRRKPKNNDSSQKQQKQQEQKGDTIEIDSKKTHVRYRQWLHDRIYGVPRPVEGKYDSPDPYPPSVVCLPSSLVWRCPYLLEENGICTWFGGRGYCHYPWSRIPIMKYCFFLNIICLFTGILACQGISDSSLDLIDRGAMAKIILKPTPDFFTEFDVEIYIGLSAAATKNPSAVGGDVIPFDQFCKVIEAGRTTTTTPNTNTTIPNTNMTIPNTNVTMVNTTTTTSSSNNTTAGSRTGRGFETLLQNPVETNCQKCETVRPQMVSGLLVAVVFLIPSMLAQCTRLYETTDLNCCKCWAIWMELISLAGFVLTWVQFYYGCFKPSFIISDTVGYTRDGYVSEPDSLEEAVIVSLQWSVGNAMIFLFTAFGLKFISLVCHICLPTPTLTRNSYEQKLYESKTTWSSTDDDPEGGGGDDGAGRDKSFSEGDDEDGELYEYYDDDDDDNNRELNDEQSYLSHDVSKGGR